MGTAGFLLAVAWVANSSALRTVLSSVFNSVVEAELANLCEIRNGIYFRRLPKGVTPYCQGVDRVRGSVHSARLDAV
jgi:hypothetical protein